MGALVDGNANENGADGVLALPKNRFVGAGAGGGRGALSVFPKIRDVFATGAGGAMAAWVT